MHRRIICLTVMAPLLLSGGCSRKPGAAAGRQRAAVQRRNPPPERHVFHEWGREGWRHSETRPEDGYVFYEWKAERTKGTAVLRDGYGMMIFYECWQPDDAPRFELYAHDRGVIARTTSLEEFKRQLSQIPGGETLRCFNTCCGGTHSGLDRAVIEEIATFCRQSGVAFLQGNDRVFCRHP